MEIRTITVLGANGTMGRNVAAIFAAFGHAKVYLVCRDKQKAKEAVMQAALSVKSGALANHLIPADYDMLDECVAVSDLVFESIAEDFDAKTAINQRISRILPYNVIYCTGSSGLSINQLSEALTIEQRQRYFGMHLFNPPYNMILCEIIPCSETDIELLHQIREYATRTLHRTVVEVKDTPAFLANRIGFYFINEAMRYAERYKDSGGIDYIDSILGSFTGRSMAPLNTADFVGLDIHASIVDNIYHNVDDYAHQSFECPNFVRKLIADGKLGRKAKAGLYKTVKMESGKNKYFVYDIKNEDYRISVSYDFSFKNEMISFLKTGNYEMAFDILKHNNSAEAKICLQFLLKYIIYSVFCANMVADTISAADDVMAMGFNWVPPLALVEALGGNSIVAKLVCENLSEQISNEPMIVDAILQLPKSNYDYRKYFRAKR